MNRIDMLVQEAAARGHAAPLSPVLDEVERFLRRYVVLTDHQAVACSLWVVHTYVADAAETTPYLDVSSAEKRSGKSRLLDVLEMLASHPWRAVLPSEAVTYRKVADGVTTLLLDEVDAIFGPKAKEHEGLRALLNAGYRRRGSDVPRCEPPSMKVKSFSTFCPKALAGIGDLPDTVADRAIPIRMKRKKPSDRVERFRERTVAEPAARIRDAITSAVDGLAPTLRDARPSLPVELDDRAQDGWEPLLAIADLVGGDWPLEARKAAVALSAGRDLDEGTGHKLLLDCKLVFDDRSVDEITTSDLINGLCAIPDAPWAEYGGKPITGRRIAKLLHPYEIKAEHKEAGSTYRRADFEDAWARYAPQTVRTVSNRMVEPKTADLELSAEPAADTSRNGHKPAPRFRNDTSDSLNRGTGAEGWGVA